MPANRVQETAYHIAELFRIMMQRVAIMPIWLGGGSGADGGTGTGPGGFIGKLVQRRVTFDLTEGDSVSSGSDPSLLENLNRLRAVAQPDLHAVMRWRVASGGSELELPDFWERIDSVSANGFQIDPVNYVLAMTRAQIQFQSAFSTDAIVVAEGVVARL